MSCPCEKTVALLKKLGAVQAAKMHEADALDREWTADEWRAHMKEEEELLFPLLESGRPDLIELLRREHMVFRQELAIMGKLSCPELVTRHSQLEDMLVGKYLEG